jgi:hypothetical protein
MAIADNEKVICPKCNHQFRAIPDDLWTELVTLRRRVRVLEDALVGTDTRMLDWLDKNSKSNKWICRMSSTGRGLRVHETTAETNYPTIREAIEAYIKSYK